MDREKQEETARIADEESQNDRDFFLEVRVCVSVLRMQGWVENNEKSERQSIFGREGGKDRALEERVHASQQTDGEKKREVKEIKWGE